MTVVSIRESAPKELARFDALNRRQFWSRDELTRDELTLNEKRTNGPFQEIRRTLRILVVDGQHQDPVNVRVELVRRFGHVADLALEKIEALRVAAVQHPDIVLLDQGLTLGESCQITKHLRFDFPRKDVWIIAITKRIDDARRKKCTAAGIDVLLADPIDPDVLETLLMLENVRVNR